MGERAEDALTEGFGREIRMLVTVNPAFSRLTGYDEDEVVGRNCRFLQGDERDHIIISTTYGPDAKGRFCDFTNTIIILTSNVGSAHLARLTEKDDFAYAERSVICTGES